MKKLLCMTVVGLAMSAVSASADVSKNCEFAIQNLVTSAKNNQMTLDLPSLSSHGILIQESQTVQDDSVDLARIACRVLPADSVSKNCEFAIQNLITSAKNLQMTLDNLSSHPELIQDSQVVLDDSIDLARVSCQ